MYFTQKCAYSIPYFPVTLFAQVTSFTWNTLSPLCLLDSYFVSEVQLKNLLCLEFSIYIHALSLLLNYIIQYLLQQICSWCMLNKFGWVSGWTSCIHSTVSWGRKVQWGLPGDPAQCQNMNKSTGLLAVCSLRTDLLSSSLWRSWMYLSTTLAHSEKVFSLGFLKSQRNNNMNIFPRRLCHSYKAVQFQKR